tara:strand:- start:29 stop:229 length:201 start_codon:yes stop_codon:yes gene_type:complete
MTFNYTDLNENTISDKKNSDQQIKTTNVNILLNRIKDDKKKTFKKKLIISILLITVIISLAILFNN